MSNLVSPGQPAAPQDGPEGAQGQDGFQGQFGPAASVGQPPAGPPLPPAPPAPSNTKRPKGKIIMWSLLAVVIVVVVIFGVRNSLSSPSNAAVGDCLKGTATNSETATEVNDFQTVACTSSDAKFKVLGKIENKTEAEFEGDRAICDKFPATTAEYWGGKQGEKGYVLCLGDVH